MQERLGGGALAPFPFVGDSLLDRYIGIEVERFTFLRIYPDMGHTFSRGALDAFASPDMGDVSASNDQETTSRR